jgi:hypothetical protein
MQRLDDNPLPHVSRSGNVVVPSYGARETCPRRGRTPSRIPAGEGFATARLRYSAKSASRGPADSLCRYYGRRRLTGRIERLFGGQVLLADSLEGAASRPPRAWLPAHCLPGQLGVAS